MIIIITNIIIVSVSVSVFVSAFLLAEAPGVCAGICVARTWQAHGLKHADTSGKNRGKNGATPLEGRASSIAGGVRGEGRASSR